MTEQKKSAIRNFLWQRIGISVVGGFFWGLLFLSTYALTPVGNRIAAIWNGPERLIRIESKLDVVIEDVRRATGEDRVIRQTPGLSYVSEPVYVGDPITLNLVIERTTLGRDCQLVDSQSLFTDRSNITSQGARLSPDSTLRQIDEAPTRLRVELVPPRNLLPGRVELYLVLEYQCGSRMLFDRTGAVTFELLPTP